MVTKIYQVIQTPEWSCPGMIIWTEVVKDNEFVTAIQQNPDNSLTYQSFDENQEYCFDKSDYAYIEELTSLKEVKTSQQIKDNYQLVK